MTLNIGLGETERVREIALAAGKEILTVYGSNFKVEAKADDSPVTEADRRAEALIVAGLRRITDTFPIVGEEAFADGTAPAVAGKPFWLVDPLDGTKEFIKRNGEFTVNIALIDAGRPVLGVVHAPAIKTTYWGSTNGAFATTGGGVRRAIAVRRPPTGGVVAVVSRSHRTADVDTFLAGYTVKREISAGSSLKFCLVASGEADVYPRFGRTMEWDTAAGHAVLRFAGGHVRDVSGRELAYGKPGFENPHFVATGGESEPISDARAIASK